MNPKVQWKRKGLLYVLHVLSTRNGLSLYISNWPWHAGFGSFLAKAAGSKGLCGVVKEMDAS